MGEGRIELEIECAVCQTSWVADYPLVCMDLECPTCRVLYPAPVVEIEMETCYVIVLPLRSRRDALEVGVEHACRIAAGGSRFVD